MSLLATRHFQKFNPLSGGNDGFKKNRKPGVFKNLTHFWRERWILKNRKPGIFKKSFQFRNSCKKTLSINLVFEPMNFPRSPMSDPTKVWYPQTHRHCSQTQDFYFYWLISPPPPSKSSTVHCTPSPRVPPSTQDWTHCPVILTDPFK